MHEQVTANPESPVRSSATLLMSHLQCSYQQLNHGRVPRACRFIVCALTADVAAEGLGFSCLAPSKLSRSGRQPGGNLGVVLQLDPGD